ncbi:hypothetical protein DL765_001878 [Monosporascus sp. GIB2]|nr:hypothetical protein DL765_001878 [Monosporascus sp. GIB2]
MWTGTIFEKFLENEPDDSTIKYRPLQYHKLRDDLERQSLDAGCENAIEPKIWGSVAANVANDIAPRPEAGYLQQRIHQRGVGFHLQNAFLDEPAEDSLLGMLSHIGLMRDPRTSKVMVPDEAIEEQEEFVEPTVNLQIPERAQLAEMLCNQPENLSPAELLELRI